MPNNQVLEVVIFLLIYTNELSSKTLTGSYFVWQLAGVNFPCWQLSQWQLWWVYSPWKSEASLQPSCQVSDSQLDKCMTAITSSTSPSLYFRVKTSPLSVTINRICQELYLFTYIFLLFEPQVFQFVDLICVKIDY